MPEQDPSVRRGNQLEVPLGLSELEAMLEAARCLECKDQPCVKGCPVGIDIPRFVTHVREGDFAAASATIREANCLPAVTGRVCPQETQCQCLCKVGKAKKDACESVSIGRLERFVADWERAQNSPVVRPDAPASGKRVAVVGSGPAGLACAGDLIQHGHEVTVFEAFHKPGGVLVYGIPEFRLPKEIVDWEVQRLVAQGVDFELNVVVGQSVTVQELMAEEGYDAVFVATGAGLPKFLEIPGESAIGVYAANEYLTRANLMEAHRFPEADTPVIRARRAAVFGGGNVAMDAARTAVRLGAEEVSLVYRRTQAEMPARVEEVHHALEEGIVLRELRAPLEFRADLRGRLGSVRLQVMELGEPDEKGRRRPVPVPGREEDLEIDLAIVAIGNDPNPLIPATTPDLATGRYGTITVDEQTLATSIPGVYAGGDIVLGAATVILAMGHGRLAASSIHAYLGGDVRASR